MEVKFMEKGKLILLILWIGIGSCRVGQVAIPEPPPLPNTYRYQIDTASQAYLPGYQHFFLNKSLQNLLDSAWDGNFDVELALQQLQYAKLSRNQVYQNYLPSFLASIQGQSSRPADNSLNGISVKSFLGTTHVEDFSASAQINWEADLWGKMYHQRKQAANRYLQSEEGLRSIRSRILMQIAQEYYTLAWLREQQELLGRNSKLSDSILQVIAGLQEFGSAGVIDLQLALANKRKADLALPSIEEQIGQSEHILSLLTGKLPGPVLTVSSLSADEFSDSLLVGMPVSILQNRPSIRYAETGMRIRANQIGIAIASMYPALQLSIATGINSYQLSNWFSWPASLFGVAGGGILQPLFQQKKLKTNRKLAEIELESAYTIFKQELYQGVREVADAQLKQNTCSVRVQKGIELLRDLEIAVEQARTSFQFGQINYLEVLTVQERWIQASLDLAESRYQLMLARIQLYYSLGGGQFK